MKKLLIIITLFASSFFFFLGDVKAYELEVDVDLTLLDENFYTFKSTMDEFIRTDTTYSDYYMIYRSGSDNSMYALIYPLNVSISPTVVIYDVRLRITFYDSTLTRIVPSSDYTSYSISGTVGAYQNYVYYTNSSLNFIPLYANFDIIMSTTNQGSVVTYKYNDFSTVNTADGVDKFKTLYMINEEYQEYVGAADAVHKEELEKIDKFYSVVFDRLSYLAEVMVSNYIYLSIVVVMVLLLIFTTIFRRYL